MAVGIAIIAIVGGLALFISLGWWLWNYSIEEYGYDPFFSWDNMLRSVVAWAFVGIAVFGGGTNPEMAITLFVSAGVVGLWIFIVTWVRTTWWIALLSPVYQILAGLMIWRLIFWIRETLDDY